MNKIIINILIRILLTDIALGQGQYSSREANRYKIVCKNNFDEPIPTVNGVMVPSGSRVSVGVSEKNLMILSNF